MAESRLNTERIEAERDERGRVEIDKQRGGIVSLEPEEARTLAVFILATHPHRDPSRCGLCDQPKDPMILPQLEGDGDGA